MVQQLGFVSYWGLQLGPEQMPGGCSVPTCFSGIHIARFIHKMVMKMVILIQSWYLFVFSQAHHWSHQFCISILSIFVPVKNILKVCIFSLFFFIIIIFFNVTLLKCSVSTFDMICTQYLRNIEILYSTHTYDMAWLLQGCIWQRYCIVLPFLPLHHLFEIFGQYIHITHVRTTE